MGTLAIRVVPFEEILFHDSLPVGISEQIIATHCGSVNSKYFSDQMEPLGRFIDKQLSVQGIGLDTSNAQYTKKNGILFITDLCDEIMDLRAK